MNKGEIACLFTILPFIIIPYLYVIKMGIRIFKKIIKD